MKLDDLRQVLWDAYADLSPQMKVAASYALENPAHVAFKSVRQLAKAADVHPSTIVRLAQVAGFSTYDPFARCFRTVCRRLDVRLEERAAALQKDGRWGQESDAFFEMARQPSVTFPVCFSQTRKKRFKESPRQSLMRNGSMSRVIAHPSPLHTISPMRARSRCARWSCWRARTDRISTFSDRLAQRPDHSLHLCPLRVGRRQAVDDRQKTRLSYRRNHRYHVRLLRFRCQTWGCSYPWTGHSSFHLWFLLLRLASSFLRNAPDLAAQALSIISGLSGSGSRGGRLPQPD